MKHHGNRVKLDDALYELHKALQQPGHACSVVIQMTVPLSGESKFRLIVSVANSMASGPIIYKKDLRTLDDQVQGIIEAVRG